MAPSSMPAPQFSEFNFKVELTAMLDPATLDSVETLWKHMPKAYLEIRRQGYEEGKLERRKEEYRKGLTAGENRG